jgi:UPF0755 protein
MPVFKRPQDGSTRSASDREAARLERERRRAEREGRPVPESIPATDEPLEAAPEPTWEPFPPDEPAPEVEAEAPEPPEPEPEDPEAEEPEPEPAAEEPEPSEDPEPAEPEPGPTAEAPREPEPEPEPEGAPEPQPTEAFEPVDVVPERRTVALPRPQTDEVGQDGEAWDRPIGTRRVSRSEYQAQPGASGMPPHGRMTVPRRRRWRGRVLALLALLLVIAVAVVGFLLYQPFHGKGFGTVIVTIPQGLGARQIGDLLAKRDVVDSGFFFGLRARINGDRSKLRAGTFHLKHKMPYDEALTVLTTPPAAAAVIDVTLPEGPSRRELAPKVREAGVRGSYLKASARSRGFHSSAYGAPKGTRSLEGFLFPDTYELRQRDATARQLVRDQLRTFRSRFAKVDLSRARRRNLSRYDVLIIASMIEREAQVPRDRRLISAVIYNRLRKGIPLGIDATLRYRLNNWSRPLRVSELASTSVYNTRKHRGLPPTPIGNPGLAAIQAAADPAKASYLFYVVKPCGDGAHAFSSTDARFERDVRAYDRARAKRGGKDPSHC